MINLTVFQYIFEPIIFLVALACALLGVACSMLGSVHVHKGESLIGDALGHSTYAGLVLIYILFATKVTLYLILGAILSATLCYMLIQYCQKYTKVPVDAIMAIFLSAFFGLGMVFLSYAQKMPHATQAQLSSYIYGQAAFLRASDLYLIYFAAIIVFIFFLFFFKEIALYLFDPQFSKIHGFAPTFFRIATLFLTILILSVGLKAVGAILISSLLIAPTIAAKQWTHHYKQHLFLSAFFAASSSFVGTYISTLGRGFSTGPSIIIVLSLLALFSIFFAPYGVYPIFTYQKKDTV